MSKFNNLPIEIQVSILRAYDKELWIISRSLNKNFRNESEVQFLMNEVQYPISKFEFYRFIKNIPEYFAIFNRIEPKAIDMEPYYYAPIFNYCKSNCHFLHYIYDNDSLARLIVIRKRYYDIDDVVNTGYPIEFDLLTI